MRKSSAIAMTVLLWLASNKLAAQTYGIGREASADEVGAWDITIGPDGKELPEGSGTAADGAQVYEVRCKECHGEAGVGGDQAALVGSPADLLQAPPKKTVGSFWPYATTLFDYTRRAMPFEEPGTLSDDQVYAVTAYMLYLNGLVGENDPIDRDSLPKIEMPNSGGFIPDPRSGR